MVEELNFNEYTCSTGDPFADIGGAVIKYLHEKMPNKSIMDLITFATNIYVNNWENNLHSFFLNSTITHNSNKGKKGIDKTLAYYAGILNGKHGVKGFCRISGREALVFPASRENHIMSGSATLVNFHHGFESGIQLSKEVLIRMFFVPLGVERLGDKVAALVCNNPMITNFFVRRNIDRNFHALGSNSSNSIISSEFSNPVNAIFSYADECISSLKIALTNEETGLSEIENVTLNLFHFTNFGAKPAISLLSLPAKIFAFYAHCVLHYKKDWNNFIFRHYSSSKFKDAHFNSKKLKWENKKDVVSFEEYKAWNNKALQFLLYGNYNQFRKLMLNHSRKELFDFKIVEIYQINIRNMDKRTLSKVKELADYIIVNRSEDEIKKAITRINGQNKSSMLRRYLIGLIAEYNKNHADNPKPLISLDEYVEFLFPDGTYWSEIRDLLLIAIYQKLHELNISADVDIDDVEDENDEIEINNY